MSDQLLRQIALVSESQSVNASDLALVSAALQKQATRDLIQFWDIKATVDAFPRLEDVPIGLAHHHYGRHQYTRGSRCSRR